MTSYSVHYIETDSFRYAISDDEYGSLIVAEESWDDKIWKETHRLVIVKEAVSSFLDCVQKLGYLTDPTKDVIKNSVVRLPIK